MSKLPLPIRSLTASAAAAIAFALFAAGGAAAATPTVHSVHWSNATGELRIEVHAKRASSLSLTLEGATARRGKTSCSWDASTARRVAGPRFKRDHGDIWVGVSRSRRFGRVLASELVKWRVTARNRTGARRKTLYEYSLPCSG